MANYRDYLATRTYRVTKRLARRAEREEAIHHNFARLQIRKKERIMDLPKR